MKIKKWRRKLQYLSEPYLCLVLLPYILTKANKMLPKSLVFTSYAV